LTGREKVAKKIAPMPPPDLGEMEHLVLLAILRLGREAYGIPIMDEVVSRSGRAVSKATVYVALKRLERKGFVASRLGEATSERGGRAKRYFRLRPAGLKAMRDSRARLLRLWRDYETVLDRA
jgi:PadR family transcriptional regulator PadR